MIVSFRISRDISMTFLIILPILAVALFFIIRSVFPVFTRVFRTYDELNTSCRKCPRYPRRQIL